MASPSHGNFPPAGWQARFPLLGPKDFCHIDRLGLPANPAGLYSYSEDGTAVCTPRGVQFLSALFEHHALDELVSGQTRQTLARIARALAPELLARNRIRMHADLLSGALSDGERSWAQSHLRG